MSSEKRFHGQFPDLYDRHLGPTFFEPYAHDIARRVPRDAHRVLELAAGTGRVTRHLLAQLPSDGELLAIDVAEPMLDIAKQRMGSDPRLTWQVADMQALPLPDHSFDVVVCQFGLMFVPDQPLALREMKRVLAPGGMLVLSTWDVVENNHASKLYFKVVHEVFPTDPPPVALPFALTDPALVERLAAGAGFERISVETVALIGEAESAAFLAKAWVGSNPMLAAMAERGVDPVAFETRVVEALATLGDRPLRTPLSAHVLTAFA